MGDRFVFNCCHRSMVESGGEGRFCGHGCSLNTLLCAYNGFVKDATLLCAYNGFVKDAL